MALAAAPARTARPFDVNLHNPFSVGLWLGLNEQQFGVNEQVRGPGQSD
jgi:hypothetical protein